MCDWTPVRNWLIGVAAAIVAAAALAIGAIVANNSVVYTYLAPIAMVAAAAVTFLAGVLIGFAITALDAFCACAGPRCAGPCNNLRTTLTAARVVLGIQFTACLVAAFPSLIPIVGSIPIYVIVGALFVQLALIISAIVFASQLASCQTAPPAPPTSGGPLTSTEPTRTTTGPGTTTGPSTTTGPGAKPAQPAPTGQQPPTAQHPGTSTDHPSTNQQPPTKADPDPG